MVDFENRCFEAACRDENGNWSKMGPETAQKGTQKGPGWDRDRHPFRDRFGSLLRPSWGPFWGPWGLLIRFKTRFWGGQAREDLPQELLYVLDLFLKVLKRDFQRFFICLVSWWLCGGFENLLNAPHIPLLGPYKDLTRTTVGRAVGFFYQAVVETSK